jgi:hypothetical protein
MRKSRQLRSRGRMALFAFKNWDLFVVFVQVFLSYSGLGSLVISIVISKDTVLLLFCILIRVSKAGLRI